MPTTPASPASSASVDRLSLGIDSPRGTEPSFPMVLCACNCFEAEASVIVPPCSSACMCFEAEASLILGCGAFACFDVE